MTEEKKIEKSKEEFCGACLAIPLAFAGVGASAYGSKKRGAYQQQKKLCFIGGVITIIVSLLIILYFMRIKKCNTCIGEK